MSDRAILVGTFVLFVGTAACWMLTGHHPHGFLTVPMILCALAVEFAALPLYSNAADDYPRD